MIGQPVARQVVLPDDREKPAFLDQWRVQARRASLGLGTNADPGVASFVGDSEFIGLGNFCAVSYSLQALDLKNKSYPFDWLRSPMDGVIHLLDTDFEDFLTFALAMPSPVSGETTTYTQTRWGGSFWHHEPEAPQTAMDFTRRIERLLGLTNDVPAWKRRVFVRAVNSTRELDDAERLFSTLRRKLPHCDIKLLLLVDLQERDELVRIASLGDKVLVYRIHDGIFAENGSKWSMEANVENYARGIALATRYWASGSRQVEACSVSTVSHLRDLVNEMDGGNTARETYWPRGFQGQRIFIRRSPRLPKLLLSERLSAAETQQGNLSNAATLRSNPAVSYDWIAQQHSFAPAIGPQLADVVVPAGARSGDMLLVNAFGQDLRVIVPDGVSTGQSLRLSMVDNIVRMEVLTVAALSTVAAAAAMASTTTAAAAACQRGRAKLGKSGFYLD